MGFRLLERGGPFGPLFQDTSPVIRETNKERRMYGMPIRSERAPLLPTALPVRRPEPTNLKHLLIFLGIVALFGFAYGVYWFIIL
jgi:hypothetical protein